MAPKDSGKAAAAPRARSAKGKEKAVQPKASERTSSAHDDGSDAEADDGDDDDDGKESRGRKPRKAERNRLEKEEADKDMLVSESIEQALQVMDEDRKRERDAALEKELDAIAMQAWWGFVWLDWTKDYTRENTVNNRAPDEPSVEAMALNLKHAGVNYTKFDLPRIAAHRADVLTDVSTLTHARSDAIATRTVLEMKEKTSAMVLAGNHRKLATKLAVAKYKQTLKGLEISLAREPGNSVYEKMRESVLQSIERVRWWPVEIYDIDMIMKDGDSRVARLLSKNATDIRVAETSVEGWSNSLVTIRESTLLTHGPMAPLLLTTDDLILASQNAQMFESAAFKTFKVIPWLAVFVLRLQMLSPDFSDFYEKPDKVEERFLGIHGRLMARVVERGILDLVSVFQAGLFSTHETIDEIFVGLTEQRELAAEWRETYEVFRLGLGPRPDEKRNGADAAKYDAQLSAWLKEHEEPKVDSKEWDELEISFRTPPAADDALLKMMSVQDILDICTNGFLQAFPDDSESEGLFGWPIEGWPGREEDEFAIDKFFHAVTVGFTTFLTSRSGTDGPQLDPVLQEALIARFMGRLRFMLCRATHAGAFVGLLCPAQLHMIEKCLTDCPHFVTKVFQLVEPLVVVERLVKKTARIDYSSSVYDNLVARAMERVQKTNPFLRSGVTQAQLEEMQKGVEDAALAVAVASFDKISDCIFATMTSVGLVMEERITAKAGVDYRFYDGKKNPRQAVHDAYNWKDPANEGNDILGWRAEMEMDWESRKKVHKKPDSTVPLDLNRVWFAQAYSSHFIAKNPKKSQAGAAGRSNSKAPSHKVFTGADRRFSPAVLATLESRMPFATNNDVKESAAKRGFVIFDNFMVYALSADEAWNFDLAETMVRDQIALILDGIGNTTQNTIVSYRLWDHDLVRGLRLRHANYDHGPQLSDLIWADQIRNIKRNIKRVQHFASLRDLQRSLLANDLIWDVGKDSEWAGIRRQEISDARKAAKAAKDDDAEYGAVAGQDSSVRHVYTDILYAMDGLVRLLRYSAIQRGLRENSAEDAFVPMGANVYPVRHTDTVAGLLDQMPEDSRETLVFKEGEKLEYEDMLQLLQYATRSWRQTDDKKARADALKADLASVNKSLKELSGDKQANAKQIEHLQTRRAGLEDASKVFDGFDPEGDKLMCAGWIENAMVQAYRILGVDCELRIKGGPVKGTSAGKREKSAVLVEDDDEEEIEDSEEEVVEEVEGGKGKGGKKPTRRLEETTNSSSDDEPMPDAPPIATQHPSPPPPPQRDPTPSAGVQNQPKPSAALLAPTQSAPDTPSAQTAIPKAVVQPEAVSQPPEDQPSRGIEGGAAEPTSAPTESQLDEDTTTSPLTPESTRPTTQKTPVVTPASQAVPKAPPPAPPPATATPTIGIPRPRPKVANKRAGTQVVPSSQANEQTQAAQAPVPEPFEPMDLDVPPLETPSGAETPPPAKSRSRKRQPNPDSPELAADNAKRARASRDVSPTRSSARIKKLGIVPAAEGVSSDVEGASQDDEPTPKAPGRGARGRSSARSRNASTISRETSLAEEDAEGSDAGEGLPAKRNVKKGKQTGKAKALDKKKEKAKDKKNKETYVQSLLAPIRKKSPPLPIIPTRPLTAPGSKPVIVPPHSAFQVLGGKRSLRTFSPPPPVKQTTLAHKPQPVASSSKASGLANTTASAAKPSTTRASIQTSATPGPSNAAASSSAISKEIVIDQPFMPRLGEMGDEDEDDEE